MHALFLTLSLCALQLWPAALGGRQQQRFVLGNRSPVRLVKVSNFAWKNCDRSCPAWVKSLSILPDPIVIPGDVTVSASGTTTVLLEAPLKAVVTLEKKVFDMWLQVPCVDHFGSCTYDDICAILDMAIPPGQPCPEPLRSYGIPCHCPFKAGTYNLPPSDIYIPNMDFPSIITNGDYRITVVISNHEQKLGCVKVNFSLRSKSQ